jgi:hypothetical protein
MRVDGAWLVCGLAALGLSCTSPPDLALRNLEALELGRSGRAQYEALFGEPRAARVVVLPSGIHDVALYGHAFEGFSGTCMRMILIELRNEVLNGYVGGSSCEEDQTRVSLEATAALVHGKGTLSMEAAIARMGKPSGIAKCPSYFGYQRLCEGATDLRAWIEVPTQALFGGRLRAAITLASFDSEGILRDVSAERGDYRL